MNGNDIECSNLVKFGQDLHKSRYYPAFRNAINEGSGQYYDLPVGTSLVGVWDLWKAGNNRAQKIAISRVEHEIADLLGFQTLQINADQTGKTLDVIVDGRPQKLHEVGAGVAQLIIVLAAALVEKPPYILIDEPELNLHPALQIKFLTTLASYATEGILYSTHSLGLARSTAERVYVVQKIRNGSSKMHIYGDRVTNYAEWLGELSYSNRIELGCEGLILVEGPTDVLFIQEFLRKLKMDSKYIVMQLGGSSLINSAISEHLAELTRITSPDKIKILIDSERKFENEPLAQDRADFVAECKILGVNVHVTKRRATENYLEVTAIQRVLGDQFTALDHYEKLKDTSKPWNKSKNWRIAREMTLEGIKDTDLNDFFNAL